MKNNSAVKEKPELTEVHKLKNIDLYVVGVDNEGKAEKLISSEKRSVPLWTELQFNKNYINLASQGLMKKNEPLLEIKYETQPAIVINTILFETATEKLFEQLYSDSDFKDRKHELNFKLNYRVEPQNTLYSLENREF